MTQTILVIGGTGMLGEPVARKLLYSGFAVRVLTRSAEKARLRFGDEYEIAAGDIEDPTSLETVLQGCQGVHISLEGGLDPDIERRGAENTAQVPLKTGVPRITYLSGASVCQANCWYTGTQARFQAEQAIQASGIPYTIFRAHFFMETLHRFVRSKLAQHIGKHPHPYGWVAAADYARMVAKAYATPAAAGRRFMCAVRRRSPSARLCNYSAGLPTPNRAWSISQSAWPRSSPGWDGEESCRLPYPSSATASRCR